MYPDVRKADIDPIWHFIHEGWEENRNPSKEFNTRFYLATNPDVKHSKVNPLVHFIRHGKKEGRITIPKLLPKVTINMKWIIRIKSQQSEHF